MNISSMNCNLNNQSFMCRKSDDRNGYSTREKAVVAGCASLGVATALAVLAKKAGYSLNPKKMFSNFKKSYFAKTEFLAKQVIGMGVGTCLGGLAGGYLIDQDKENRRAKMREAVMQIGNISIPIWTVARFNDVCEKHGKAAKAVGSLAGIFVGVYAANFLMNKLGNILFNKKDERGVKIVDFSAHVDDVMAGAQYISKNKLVHEIARIVPFALTLPGIEVGTKKAGDNAYN